VAARLLEIGAAAPRRIVALSPRAEAVGGAASPDDLRAAALPLTDAALDPLLGAVLS
jgi:hypothetical protein